MRQPERRKTFTHICVYLLLRRGNEVLLLERKNTGFCDGEYGLISGHIEEGESAIQGLIREAKEEAGILVSPSHLKFAHCGHNKTNRFNLDLFFTCDKWQGEVMNSEPDKCSDLRFFSIDQLPKNTIPYIANALKAAFTDKPYSEYGWS